MNLEFNRYGIMPILLILLGCFGGLVVGFCVDHDNELMAIISTTMLALAMMLAVQPMKLLLGCFGLAMFVDLIVLLF